MPETEAIVINTGPLLALIAAYGDLSLLERIYPRVLVPCEVCREMEAGGASAFGNNEFCKAAFLEKQASSLVISPYLSNSLDLGEASVIQLALNKGIHTVCIDEAVGRRVARLNGLKLTGSIGILIRAKRSGIAFSMDEAIEKMQVKGIYLSRTVIDFALAQVEETK
jgi:predicted nucleic acid-binding protein